MQEISILNLPVGIFKIASDKKIIYVNKCFCQIAGYPKVKLLGEKWLAAVHPDDRRVFIPLLDESMQKGEHCKFEFRFLHQDKAVSWVLCHVVPETNQKTSNYVGTITDITELKETQAALQELARFDPLTQLPNRYLFEDILPKSLLRATRNETTLALFYLDIDYFKNVNDFFGHGIGDAFLKEVGNRLKQSVRGEDFIVRLGGDEFAIILEDIHDFKDISLAADRILEALKMPFVIDGHDIASTVSIGISVYPDEGTNSDTIVQHADQALYQAKQAGRNCYKYYNKTMQEQLDRYMLVVNHLRNAVKEKQFELFYQPKIDADTNSMVGMEALLRWNNSLVKASPQEFIGIAEEAGLMNQIGAWVIKTALQQYKEWFLSNKKIQNIKISINISPSQLNDSGIIETVTQILKETRVPTENILFELTETAVMKKILDNKSVLQVFLTELGIGISIDDFGTGYSSLTYLKQLPVKELKIDKSFIDDIGKNKTNELIIKAIINLAKILDLEVVAEGVESKQQVDFLLKNQCRIVQGYYFSKPLSVVDMTAYIKAPPSQKK